MLPRKSRVIDADRFISWDSVRLHSTFTNTPFWWLPAVGRWLPLHRTWDDFRMPVTSSENFTNRSSNTVAGGLHRKRSSILSRLTRRSHCLHPGDHPVCQLVRPVGRGTWQSTGPAYSPGTREPGRAPAGP